MNGEPITINANISAQAPIRTVRVLWNGELAQQFTGSYGMNYTFNWSFNPPSPQPQNTLTIEAVDAFGQVGRNSTTVSE